MDKQFFRISEQQIFLCQRKMHSAIMMPEKSSFEKQRKSIRMDQSASDKIGLPEAATPI
jgi:hypothetical protein